jgi:hypothetical protein
MTGLNRGDKRAPIVERGDDLYETPSEAVHALLKHERLPNYLWEPACGPGSITRVLRGAGKFVHATDLVNYRWEDHGEEPGFAEHGIDFLMARSAYTAAPIGAIVTNPPFKLANEFVEHARKLCPKVIMLLRLAFYESERRSNILDAGDLARVLVFRKRLPQMHRHGWEGPKANSGMCFAWFIWDAEHKGDTVFKRISWEPIGGAKPAAPRRKRTLDTETASIGL